MPLVAANSPLSLNLTFPVEVVVFLALLYLLSRYVFPPINNALKTRQRQIAQALSEAEAARREVDQARQKEKSDLADARRQAQEILDRAEKLGEELREELRQKGRQEQEAMITRARAELAQEREQAVSQLRRQVADLVLLATQKILEEELDQKRQRRLIDEALAEVDLSA
ncbi:MAG TPA: F0F1 ATP synthase subunit B [Candidatus Dormibacteraeota bacterium]|nr:F0F1 ATP synthase subunit B [Candidatus Dormibacteraeota bacterium]